MTQVRMVICAWDAEKRCAVNSGHGFKVPHENGTIIPGTISYRDDESETAVFHASAPVKY